MATLDIFFGPGQFSSATPPSHLDQEGYHSTRGTNFQRFLSKSGGLPISQARSHTLRGLGHEEMTIMTTEVTKKVKHGLVSAVFG
jgi:hypothetical protein